MKERFFELNDFFNDMIKAKTSIIPIISEIDEDMILTDENIPNSMPLLPLRGNVLFPKIILPVTAGRKKSIKLLNEAYKSGNFIAVVAQRNDVEDPVHEDLFPIGTAAKVIKTLDLPDGNLLAILQGGPRIMLKEITETEPYLIANAILHPETEDITTENIDTEDKVLLDNIKELYGKTMKHLPNIPQEASSIMKNIKTPAILINFIASHIEVTVDEKQTMLDINTLKERAKYVMNLLVKEMQFLEVKEQIQNKVKFDMDKQQREYFLSQQLKTIQEELGGSPIDQDFEDLNMRALRKKWSEEMLEIFGGELDKLTRLNPQSPDYSTQLNYLNTLLDLPWNEYTKDNLDLKHAQKTLDKDHYGIEKVKERILEYLAVLKLKGDMKSPILCLVGPPGVGKTSLGKSIASALNRKYVRMALGGQRDEAEIRGHRRTYIGAMPGRIIQNITKF